MKLLVKLKDSKVFVLQENAEKPMYDFDVLDVALKTIKGEQTPLLHILSEYAGEDVGQKDIYAIEIIQ